MSPSTITLIFLAFAIISFVLEKIPLGLTATIVAIGLNLTGVLSTSDTFSGYVNSNVILCVGMFVVGQALFETGMANKIGGLVTKFAKTERMLIIAIMVIVGIMSGFLSNTGTAAVLIPVVCGIADESGYSRSRLLMPLVFAAALGGNLSIIGAPGNLMGVNALQEMGMETSFFMYAPVGIPMLLAGIVYFAFIGYRFLPDGTHGGEAVEKQRDYSDVPQWKQFVSLAVLVVVILAMIFEKQIGVKIQISACVGAIVLVLTGVLTEKEALKSIDLKVVLLFGGSLALAKALETTGAGSLIADAIVGALGANPNPIILLLVIFVVGCALTNFMSNTATTALMVPIATSLAQSLGADPRSMIIATVIACSCAYATPIGMPANTMVVGLGGYKFNDYVKETGVRVIVGKGGMGPNTERACKEFGAIHCVFPAGCAVVAATEVLKIQEHHWDELGMPETLWCNKVKEFGPLIVSIDPEGRNLFEEQKVVYNEKKEAAKQAIYPEVKFIK